MPITLPKKRGLPERIRRHVALRELAHDQARERGETLTRAQANQEAKRLAKEPLPHTRAIWDAAMKSSES